MCKPGSVCCSQCAATGQSALKGKTLAVFLLVADCAVSTPSCPAPQSEPHTEAYAAAKAGMLGMTHAQAISLAHKVRCVWKVGLQRKQGSQMT